MRSFFFLLLLLLSSSVASAQTAGFSKTILLPNAKSCTIASLVVDQDTIVCFGTMYGTFEQKWGTFLAKFDSIGTFLQISTCFDSLYQQTIDPYCQLIRTADGGYLGVGSQGIGNKTAAYKFSHTGTLEWTHFYRENDFQVVITYSPHELADGYLCFGRYAVNYDNSNFVMKLSKTGDLIWFSKDISIAGYNDLMSGKLMPTGDNILLCGGFGPMTGTEVWSKPVLFEIDTNGQLVWDWYGEINDKESGISALALSPGGNIVYIAKKYFTNTLNGLSAKLKFRCIQPETGNTLWQTELPSFDLDFSDALIPQIKASPDGSGFDAIGYHQHWYSGAVIQGILAHLDWNGNLIWQRYDTVHVDTALLVSENKLYNMAYLSSGAIIGVGEIKRSDPYTHLEGWLIKWSPNGCLDAADCATVSTHLDLSGGDNNGWQNWEIYPNPAAEFTWLFPPENLVFSSGSIQIVNISGQIVHQSSFKYDTSGQYKVALSQLPQGLYFYQLFIDGKAGAAGRLVRR